MSEAEDDEFAEGIDFEGFQAGLQTFGAALLSGVATLLVVTIVVTELIADEIEFSLLVGLPAGLVSGVLVGGIIYIAANRRRPGVAQVGASLVMGFAAGFMIAYFVAIVVLDIGTVEAMGAGAIVGLLTAVVSLIRNRSSRPP